MSRAVSPQVGKVRGMMRARAWANKTRRCSFPRRTCTPPHPVSGDRHLKKLLLFLACAACLSGQELDPAKLLAPGTDSWPNYANQSVQCGISHSTVGVSDSRHSGSLRDAARSERNRLFHAHERRVCHRWAHGTPNMAHQPPGGGRSTGSWPSRRGNVQRSPLLRSTGCDVAVPGRPHGKNAMASSTRRSHAQGVWQCCTARSEGSSDRRHLGRHRRPARLD